MDENINIKKFKISGGDLMAVWTQSDARIRGGEDNLKWVYDSFDNPKCIVSNVSLTNMILNIEVEKTLGEIEIIDSNLKSLNLKGTFTKIVFKNCTIGDVLIKETNFDSIEFWNSSTGKIEIYNSKFSFIQSMKTSFKSFYIFGSIGERFSHSGVKSGKMKINSSEIERIKYYNNGSIEGFSFENSKCLEANFSYLNTGSISVYSDSIIEKTRISNLCRIRNVGFNGKFLGEIEISDSEITNEIYFGLLPEKPVHVNFENVLFQKLDFENTTFPESSTMIAANCSINQMYFNNFCNNGTIFFSGLKPFEEWEDFIMRKDFIYDPVYENFSFQFKKKELNSTLRIADSDLGNFQIINSDLKGFQKFEFLNSKMLEVFIAGSKLPNENQFQRPEDSDTNLNEQKRLAFGQFKKIYENQGDRASSLQYLALEMEAYRKQLQKEGIWKNIGELIILHANRISTFYGTRWWQGAIMTLLVMAGCFTVFCRLQGYELGDGSKAANDEFRRLVSYSFYYLNPLRDNDSIAFFKDADLTPYARIVDFWSRIFVAYFVVQTVQAFRKLGKSSG